MQRRPWWPYRLGDQRSLMINVRTKIGVYQTPLGLTAAQITAIQNICDSFIQVLNFYDASKATMQAVTQWRDRLFYGQPEGETPPDPPVFVVGMPSVATIGMVNQFFEFRDLIVASKGYDLAIGEDLWIVGPQKPEPEPDQIAPSIRTVPKANYTVQVKGSMQGMSAIRIEYAPKGGQFAPVAYLTNLPGSFQITPAAEGQPESGHLRARYVKRNVDFGGYSPEYPVTVS